MESLSGEPHWAMSMGSSREGMPSSSSATEKTRQQFLHREVQGGELVLYSCIELVLYSCIELVLYSCIELVLYSCVEL